MELTAYSDAHAFLSVAQPYLERQEGFNGLILGIATRVRDGTLELPASVDPAPTPLLMAAEWEGDLALAAVQTPPHGMVLYSTPEHCDAAVECLVRRLMEIQHSLPGVVGPDPVAQRFAEVWAGARGQTFRLAMDMLVYELRQVRFSGTAPGCMRVAAPADVELLAEWVTCFNREVGLPHPPDTAQRVSRRIARQGLYIWEDDGRPVSLAGPTRPTPHGTCINTVYTPPELRGRGYASACVAALSQLLLDTGNEFCTLFTDVANPTSNSIYQRIGYEKLGSFTEYSFD